MEVSKTKEVVLLGILTAIVFVGQVIMGFLPNIEVVTLLFIVYTLVLGKKVFFIIYAFVILEGFTYGIHTWWISYLYVWSLQALVTLLFRKQTSVFFWSILSGFYGITFGALCAIPYFISGGWAAGFGYWASGIGFDITHCIGNVVVCLVLYKPLRFVLEWCTNEFLPKRRKINSQN